jgi:hypothetical protein
MMYRNGNQEKKMQADTTEQQMKKQLEEIYRPRRDWYMETRDEQGRPQTRYEIHEGWEYCIQERHIEEKRGAMERIR